jgi:hypothetical protein
MKYIDQEIKDSILEYLGEEGHKYFSDLKDEYGTCWVNEDMGDGFYVHNWTTVGRRIKNHVIERFPDVVEEFGDYEDFEDYIYTIVEDIFG